MSFDERPEADPHHECRHEIDELRKEIEFKNTLIENYKLSEDRWRESAIKNEGTIVHLNSNVKIAIETLANVRDNVHYEYCNLGAFGHSGLCLRIRETLKDIKPEDDKELKLMDNKETILKLKSGIKWIAQTVHQAHHEKGFWEDCEKNTCDYAQQLLNLRCPCGQLNIGGCPHGH